VRKTGLAGAPDPGASPSLFAAFVPARLDAYWHRAFASMGRSYRPPTLDLFGYATSLPCFPLLDFNDGPPYYCFLNDTIYLPLQYVSDLAGATGTLGERAENRSTVAPKGSRSSSESGRMTQP